MGKNSYFSWAFLFLLGGIVAVGSERIYKACWWRMRNAAEMERIHNWDAYIPENDPTLSRRIGAALLPKAQATKLYVTLAVLTRIFDDHGVTWWACGGTLLGAIRNGGIIPTDDDIDLCVFEKDLPKLEKARAALKQQGFSLRIQHGGVKIKSMTHPRDSYQYLGLFVMKEVVREGKHEVVLSSPKAEKIWPTFRFEKKYMFPLKKVPFGPTHVWVPRVPYPHLDKYYKNWNSVMYVWNHGHPFPPFYMTITPELRKPAPWCEETFSSGAAAIHTPQTPCGDPRDATP
ncbi:LicD family protein [Candidatus Hepatobacter penaei]|uniref:LicD family protein n=1 Tax=Candidatus Hepatobacter penaei TaxID=1274402 RepID=UPI0004F34427|nr:LicD family protein [Candidatus Hepatobacter penaei]